MPASAFELNEARFGQNLTSSRRGAASGRSGLTNKHLRPLLENVGAMHLFFRLGDQLARAAVPGPIIDALRLGRMTAFEELSQETPSADWSHAQWPSKWVVQWRRQPLTTRTHYRPVPDASAFLTHSRRCVKRTPRPHWCQSTASVRSIPFQTILVMSTRSSRAKGGSKGTLSCPSCTPLAAPSTRRGREGVIAHREALRLSGRCVCGHNARQGRHGVHPSSGESVGFCWGPHQQWQDTSVECGPQETSRVRGHGQDCSGTEPRGQSVERVRGSRRSSRGEGSRGANRPSCVCRSPAGSGCRAPSHSSAAHPIDARLAVSLVVAPQLCWSAGHVFSQSGQPRGSSRLCHFA